uniref:Uncharacterized protein n=2 Tax=Caenorhabditis japonica TaxID=281687 RepID=A0A8R1IHN6_CAEJA
MMRDAQKRVISIHAADGRLLRRSTTIPDQFIFTDSSINIGELRFMRTSRVPERAAELLHHLVERIRQQQNH